MVCDRVHINKKMLTYFTVSVKKFIVAELNCSTSTNLSALATIIHSLSNATVLSIRTESIKAKLPNCWQLYSHGGRVDQTHLPIHATTAFPQACPLHVGTTATALIPETNLYASLSTLSIWKCANSSSGPWLLRRHCCLLPYLFTLYLVTAVVPLVHTDRYNSILVWGVHHKEYNRTAHFLHQESS